MAPVRTTRLAPSPSGSLHLGNARTFLINWAIARRNGWRIVLRIEDLNTSNLKPESIPRTIKTLRWLGLDWDEGPLIQSNDTAPYESAMQRLAEAGVVYTCTLSRKEIEAASDAPQEGDRETRYPPHLRPPVRPGSFDEAGTNWRLAVEPSPALFEDRVAGPTEVDPAASVGDFVVWTRRGEPSYQLAVAVDDARQGVTDVVRGNDLLDSVGRQLLIYRLLHLGNPPTYWHVPLVRGPDGRRLAKRHGDTRLSSYQTADVPGERAVGLLASWCGVVREPEPMSASDFAEAFDVSMLPPTDVVFTEADDTWLRSG